MPMKSKYFKIHELVPKKLYKAKGEGAWRYIQPALIYSLDTLKERFPEGSMTINNYFWNGIREWSGLRTPDSPYFSETSMHSFMQACDVVFSKYTAEEVRQDIIDNPDLYPYIKGLEDEVDWLHFDIRNEDELVIFKKVQK